MQDHKDQEFLGVISVLLNFVEIIENKCEGMCRIRDIKDDYYTFDSEQYALVGEQKKLLQLGDFMLKLKMLIWLKTARF
jgi:exoribonuclease R